MWIVTCFDPTRWNGLASFRLLIGEDPLKAIAYNTFFSLRYVEKL